MPRTRMFKALGGLALSMAAGAFLLASIKPGALRSLTHSPILLHARGQSGAAEEDTVARWEAVKVICAVKGEAVEPAHLIVNEAGHLLVNPGWREMVPAEGAPNHLTIRFDVSPNAALYNAEQFLALHDLLIMLDEETDLPVDYLIFESRHPRILRLTDHL